MTLNELIEQLEQVRDEHNAGEFQVFDTDAHPIISAVVSEDDFINESNRVYIEAEF